MSENRMVKQVKEGEIESLSPKLAQYVLGDLSENDDVDFDPFYNDKLFVTFLVKLARQGISVVSFCGNWRYQGVGYLPVNLKGLSYREAVLTVALAVSLQGEADNTCLS